MAILLVFCIIGCDGDDEPEIYTVTIGTLTNGTIIANPTRGIEGTEINLTVIPNNYYRLKKNTLKYDSTVINEATLNFIMPSHDVHISANFETMFIGSWIIRPDDLDSMVIIFFDNNIVAASYSGLYRYKGTWDLQEDNIIAVVITHNTPNFDDVLTLEEVNIERETPINFTCELLSSELIKRSSPYDDTLTYFE